MPKIVDHDEYRQTILDRSLQLLIKKGYANITMRNLAKEVGVTTGTLYHYFPTKKDILEQMFAYISETNISDYLDQTRDNEGVTEKLDYLSQFLMKNEDYYRQILLVAVDLCRNLDAEAASAIFTEFSREYTQLFASELGMPPNVATSFFIFLIGLVFHRILTPQHISYKQQVQMIKLFVEAYLKMQTAAHS